MGAMFSTSSMLWGTLFGGVGLGYFIYGKKQGAIVPLVTGILLSVFPFFVTNAYLIVLVGCLLIAVPYFVRM
jgi:hypothetical protein